MQTHASESDWAHGYALERFGITDTAALDGFGLLRPHSVLAHAVHVTDDDAGRLVDRGVGIAHCPLSNAYFANGVLPVRRLLDRGVAIGLGTDVAGGASPSLLAQCQHAVTMSRVLEDGTDVRRPRRRARRARVPLDIVTAFWMATVGGAEAVGLPVGLIEPGPALRCVRRRHGGRARQHQGLARPRRPPPRVREDRPARRPGDITSTWVDGRLVSGRPDRRRREFISRKPSGALTSLASSAASSRSPTTTPMWLTTGSATGRRSDPR